MCTIDKELLLDYLDGTLSPADASRLLKWCNESNENKDFLLSIKELSMSMRYDSDKKKSDCEREWLRFIRRSGMRDRRHIVMQAAKYLSAAAVAGIAIWLGMSWRNGKEAIVAYGSPIKIETGIGEQATTILPDGSTIKLNSCTSLSYSPEEWKSRRHVSISGEAAFDIAHDESRPFTVSAAKYDITVLGTVFNVNTYPEASEDRVALKSGKIRIDVQDSKSHSMDVTPGNCFIMDNASGACRITAAEADEYSWEDGEIVFANDTITEKADELYRHFGYKFMTNSTCGEMRFRATFKGESLNEFLGIIKRIAPSIRYQVDEPSRTVTMTAISQ